MASTGALPSLPHAVMAGESHPLYLTSSIIGGGAYNRFQGETVYAGGEDSHGAGACLSGACAGMGGWCAGVAVPVPVPWRVFQPARHSPHVCMMICAPRIPACRHAGEALPADLDARRRHARSPLLSGGPSTEGQRGVLLPPGLPAAARLPQAYHAAAWAAAPTTASAADGRVCPRAALCSALST